MTIRAKILTGFFSVFAIGLVLGLLGLISTYMLTSASNELNSLQEAGTEVSNILNAHYAWRHELLNSVLSEKNFTGSTDPTSCALGKWKNSNAAQKLNDPQVNDLLSKIDSPHSFIHNEAKKIADMLSSGDINSAKFEVIQNTLPKTEETISILNQINERYKTLINQKNISITSLGSTMTIMVITIIGIGTAIFFSSGPFVIKGIMNPIRKLTAAAQSIALGDLDVEINYPVNDEIGKLSNSFQDIVDSVKIQMTAAEALANGDLSVNIQARNAKDSMNLALQKMINNLNNMFNKINQVAVQVSVGSRQVADGAQLLAQSSTEQATAVDQLSSSIKEIAQKTSQNSHTAKEASVLSDSIKDSAEKGSLQMNDMMNAVNQIGDASNKIKNVIKVIDDIAFQTNILALNAAVEAARAGSAGKGFAIVAEEVRNLAAKSAEAAKDTGILIENSVEKANIGLKIATDTSESFKEIVQGIERNAEILAQISKSSEEQESATSQINIGIEHVSDMVQQNSATSQQSAASSQEISSQCAILEEAVAYFKLTNKSSD